MTFQSDINPLKILPSASLEQDKQANEISLQEWIKSKIDNQIKSVNPSDTILSTVRYDIDWASTDSYAIQVFVNGSYQNAYYVYKTFRVELGEINPVYLEYFKFEIVSQNGENGEIISTAFSPATSYFTNDRLYYNFRAWDIKDLVTFPESVTKKVALVASYVYFHRTLDFRTFKSKLVAQYCNTSIIA